MNGSPGHVQIDKAYLDSLFEQGKIDTTAYNMLNEGRTGYDEGDPFGEFGLKKKAKGTKSSKSTKKCKVGIPFALDSAPPEPVVDDSVPQAPVDAKGVSEAERNEAWDVLPSPPSQPPEDGYEEVRSAQDVRKEEGKNKEVEQFDAAGWVFTWCFRCKREDEWRFSGKTLPEWLVTILNYKGEKAEPIVLPICCMGCNNKHRPATISVAEEERKMRQAFEALRLNCDSLGEESLQVAKARIGREVSMIRWNGRAGCVDIEMMKKNLKPEDIVVSLSLEAFREGKMGADLELNGLAGGLF